MKLLKWVAVVQLCIVSWLLGVNMGARHATTNCATNLQTIGESVGAYVQQSQRTRVASEAYEAGLQRIVVKAKQSPDLVR